MRLYHGSNVEVRSPRLLRSDRRLDFGSGFYLTSSLEQASRWAVTTTRRRERGTALVSVFDFDEDALERLHVLTFQEASADWLHYVGENRGGESSPNGFDLVIGPVANDSTMPVLRLYFSGIYSEEETIRRLQPQNLTDQYAFKTKTALDALTFQETRGIS